jgi:hypothetical protein
MNKKFFTLIASALMLVASLGTANAADEISGTGGPAAKLPYGNSGNLYQLDAIVGPSGTDTFKLAVSNDGILYGLLKSVSFSNFGESLWCVNISKENQGANPKFDFTNKSTGHLLAVSAADTLALATDSTDLNYGVYSGWGFSKTYEDYLQDDRAFSTYYTADSVYVLVNKGILNDTMRVGVKAFRADAIDYPSGAVYTDPDVLRFTINEPANLILNANEFNTKLNTQAAANVKLTFTPDRNNTSLQNPWSDNSLWATEVGTHTGYMRFQKNKDDNKTFLRVDTSYANSVGVKFLNFAFDSVAVTIPNQYEFQVRYDVTRDSISIQVYEARFNLDDNPTWYNSYVTSDPDSLLVKLQDLVTQDKIRIITIGTEPVNTKAEFGIGGCEPVGINLTSLDNDLYVIKKGELTLVVPIYTDTLGPKWVKLDDAAVGGTVDPNYIPAYQWAIEKTRKDHPEISPIRITNREFPNVHLTVNSLQLKEDADVTLYGTGVKKENFTAVPSAQKKDSLLGYKYITEDDSRFNTYVFNYLHKYNDEQFLNVKKIGTDTSLFVDVAKTQFELTRYYTGDQRYGYYTNDIPDLSRLKKVAYTVKVKDQSRNTNKYISVNKLEKRYVVATNVADTAVFLLKTNNTRLIDGAVKPYYALVDTGSYAVAANEEVVKVGIADETLWAYVQVQKETRTSAFAVQEWTEPLYRRFDGETYGSRDIKELFGSTANAPQWLKFTKQNNWGSEFLFENSRRGAGSPDPNKPNTNDYRDGLTAQGNNISFLGLYNLSQYPENGDKSNYTIYVDTAFVKRKSNGEGSTDYKEYTAKPQYMLAVRPEFVKGDTLFIFRQDSIWSSSGELIGINPGSIDTIPRNIAFTRGFYIFNAQDSIGSADADNNDPRRADYVGKFTYGAEFTTRLAFVDGVHMGDTFYVLRKNPLTTDIDSAYLLTQVHFADKHYLGANTHYLPRWHRNGNPLWGTTSTDYYNNRWNGKSMVFQFRLIDPEGINDPKNAQSRAFLIESRNNEGFGGPTEEMGPQSGRWIKIQNGVPVVSQLIDKDEAQQNGAEIFNVTAGTENKAVGNELAPAVSTVKVLGETGAVTILNASGKKVAITNILGQTVAGQILSSDNATIALPKGIVVVAIEGEAAVKAIVK